MADQDYHLAAAEKRGYDRAVEVLREEAARTIEKCETAAAEFAALSSISRTAAECAEVSRISGRHVADLVERVAERG